MERTSNMAAPAGSMIATLGALYRSLSRRRQRNLIIALSVMLLGAFAELLTIGAVLPFLALVSNPASAETLPGFRLFAALVGGQPGENLIVEATAFLIVATILAAVTRMVILRVTHKFVFGLGHEIGTAIFSRMLHQPYSLFVSRNSSELLGSVEKVHAMIFGVLMPLMQGTIASLIALAIIAFLFVIEPTTAAIATGSVVSLYLGVSIASRRRLKANSAIIGQLGTARMKALQEGLGGIRDILLEQSQPIFEESFRKIDYRYRGAQAANQFIAGAPRYLIEAAGIVMIGLLALYMSGRPGGIVAAIPVLGALALGAQRLLPLLQIAYTGWSQFTGNLQMVQDIVTLLHAPVVASERRRPGAPVVPFCTDIVFDRVGFRYPGRDPVLHDIDLNIARGARIGLSGTTGSGKSTFLDLFMALLDPAQGQIRIDGRPLDDASRADWQAQIAHVPQSIYLADSSIAANIAFGEEEAGIDLDRVREAARHAQLDDFIERLPEGYATLVGERGVRISGGQRQRIAIARALYKQANVLIFDEATGQLDQKTEKAVMDAIAAMGRDITMLIVAHRPSALAGCDRVVRIENGRIVAIENAAA